METTLLYGTIGAFAATIFSMFLINYNPHPMLLVLLPMWGLVFGISIAKVVLMEDQPKKRKRFKK